MDDRADPLSLEIEEIDPAEGASCAPDDADFDPVRECSSEREPALQRLVVLDAGSRGGDIGTGEGITGVEIFHARSGRLSESIPERLATEGESVSALSIRDDRMIVG
jgi:hypothetical protein